MKDEPVSGVPGSAVAVAAPMAERPVALLPLPPADVEERILAVFAAPIEERSGDFSPIPPASVKDRSFIAFVPSVEDRSGALASIPPASVIDRSFATQVVAVEERSAMLASIPPASVGERSKVAIAIPVVDKGFVATALVPAPMEERVAVRVARAEVRQIPLERATVELKAASVAQLARIGKPLPGVATESDLVAAKTVSAPAAGVVKAALSTPVVIVAAKGDVNMSRESDQPPVKLAAVQKRLPSVMIDRKGGFFFM
jgi:hypothetical protein